MIRISNWPPCLWQTQIQMLEYGLNDTIRFRQNERNYIDTLLIYTLWYDFSNDYDAYTNFDHIFVTKKLSSWNILILRML